VRIDQLSLRIEGDELTLRFHDRMTVVSGVGPDERVGMENLILGALLGEEPRATALTVFDSQGRLLTQRRAAEGRLVCTDSSGRELPSLLSMVGVDPSRFRRLCLLRADDLWPGPVPAPSGQEGNRWNDEPAELVEARLALAKMEDELEEGNGLRSRAETVRRQLAAVEDQIRQTTDGQAKRRYARLLMELQRVRAEAAALTGGSGGLDGDDRLFGAGEEIRILARYWQGTDRRREAAVNQFADRERLDPQSLAQALRVPDHMPAGLDALAARLDAAERDRDELAARLTERVAAYLPEPSHPAVVRLARQDQNKLWAAAAAVETTEQALEQQSLRLGGVGDDDMVPTLISAIDHAHNEVEEAEGLAERRRLTGMAACTAGVIVGLGALLTVPVLSPVAILAAGGVGTWAFVIPKMHRAKAGKREFEALLQADMPSWLAMHMRRIDPTIDPDARRPLADAAIAHHRALATWSQMAGDIVPEQAWQLEQEVRLYAAGLNQQSGVASEVEELHRRLIEVAEPAVNAVREEVVAACRPFGIEDASAAAATVRSQVALAATARLQQELEDAERAELSARQPLEARLAELGFNDGPTAARVGGFEWALQAALTRAEARTSARPVEEVHADLVRLEALARSEARPEWGSNLGSAEADEPDIEQLHARREELSEAWLLARRQVPDVERLTDRHGALARRVSVLEGQVYGSARPADPMEPSDVESRLLARVAMLRHPGGGASGIEETVPLVLDDPFIRLHGDPKWAVLDLIERLGSQAQVIYLTSDPDVVVWARRRVAASAITLLEPTSEPVL
jgi:hypothetical protein